jgi:hypothetical protein
MDYCLPRGFGSAIAQPDSTELGIYCADVATAGMKFAIFPSWISCGAALGMCLASIMISFYIDKLLTIKLYRYHYTDFVIELSIILAALLI